MNNLARQQPPETVGADKDGMKDRLEAFVGGLEEEANRRVDLRKAIETRMIEDLRQYHGKYSPEELAAFENNSGSRVFLNLTRPKTNAMMARLWDLLFPTDDRNWGIQPTPVPEMTDEAESSLSLADDAKETLEHKRAQLEQIEASIPNAPDDATRQQLEQQAESLAGEMEEAETIASAAQRAADDLHATLEEAKKRALLMQEEIDDQLKSSRYQAECRDMITDACKLGIGILKGPVLGEKTRQKWEAVQTTAPDGTTRTMHVLSNVKDDATPGVYRVDPWSFFPDPDTARVEDCEGIFERHIMNKSQLRRFARHPDVDEDAVRAILRAGPGAGGAPSYLTDLSSLTDQKSETPKDVFTVWEYTGPVEAEDLMELALQRDDEEMLDILDEDGEIDPLKEINARIWFCQGKVLRYALHHMDSGEPIYSVFNLEEDEHGLFGFGLPYLMRDNQAILNAALRMLMDNAGLSVSPQVVVNKKLIRPENGNWNLEPRKVWIREDNFDVDPKARPFEVFNIQSNQQDLAAIMEMARQGMDETASLPQIAQGEQGAGVTKTAQGMALLMNSANVVFRRTVKNFDDNVTVPMIRRFYHFNMQFSAKDAIKGDFETDARGSSVLLVREMMAQNLIMIAQMFGDHPVYGSWLKHDQLLTHIFRAHMIPASDIAKSKREYEADEERKSKAPSPEVQAMQADAQLKQEELAVRREEIEVKREIANMDNDTKRYVADRSFDVMMERLAESMNISLDQLEAKVQIENNREGAKERRLAVEVADKQRTGVGAGGAV